MFQTAVLELKEVQKSEKTLDKHLFSFLDQYKTLRWRRRSDSFGIRFTHTVCQRRQTAPTSLVTPPPVGDITCGAEGVVEPVDGDLHHLPQSLVLRTRHHLQDDTEVRGQSRSEPPRQQTSHLNFYSLTLMNTSRSFTGSMPAAASRCLRKSMKTKYFWGVLNIFIFSRNQRSTDRKSDCTERRTDMLETN